MHRISRATTWHATSADDATTWCFSTSRRYATTTAAHDASTRPNATTTNDGTATWHDAASTHDERYKYDGRFHFLTINHCRIHASTAYDAAWIRVTIYDGFNGSNGSDGPYGSYGPYATTRNDATRHGPTAKRLRR